MSSKGVSGAKSKSKQLSHEEIQAAFTRLQSEINQIGGKIGELEQEADEHDLVLATLEETLAKDPDRKCFRLVGGVLTERTVKEVAPAVRTNRDGIKNILESLFRQYKQKEQEFTDFVREHNIRPANAR